MTTADHSDPYAVLGIRRDATAAQIGAAFRRQAKANHPDKHAEKSDLERNAHAEQFRRAKWAFDLLGNPEQRAYYDQHGRTRDTSAASPPTEVERTLRRTFLKVTTGLARRDVKTTDLIYKMRLIITDERIALRTEAGHIRDALEEIKALEGRFLRDEIADNTISRLLAEQVLQAEAVIAAKTVEAEHLKACLDELQHWRFVTTAEQAEPTTRRARLKL